MKMYVKITCIVAIVLMLIGGIFIGVGYANGGSFMINWYDLSDCETKVYNQIYDVKKIKVNTEIAEVKVESVETDSKEITVEVRGKKFNKFILENRQGTLSISTNEKGILFFSDLIKEVVIYVPLGTEFESIDIETGIGELELTNIKAKRIDLEVGIGGAHIEAIEADKISIDGGIGDIDAYNIVADKVDVESGIGDIELSIKGNLYDYAIDTDRGIGRARINGMKYQKTMGTIIGKEIDAECGIGDIDIQIAE